MLAGFGIFVQVLLGLALPYVLGQWGLEYILILAPVSLGSLIGFSIARRSALWGFLFGFFFCVAAAIYSLLIHPYRIPNTYTYFSEIAVPVGIGECIIGLVVGAIAGRRSRRRYEGFTDGRSSEGAIIEEASDIKIQIADEQTPIGTVSAETTSSVICPVCQSGFVSGQKTITCPKCGVKHHKECWNLIGGCSTFGCKHS